MPQNAFGCILSVSGVNISDGDDGIYHAETFDTKSVADGARISIMSMGDGVWIRDSAPIVFILDKTNDALSIAQVSGLRVDGETLSWQPFGGATAYRVIDIDYNVTKVTTNSYDMSDKNLVIAVYSVHLLFRVFRNIFYYLNNLHFPALKRRRLGYI